MIFDFVTNKIFAKLLAGKIAAGDSKKLGGETKNEWQTKLDRISTQYIREFDTIGWYRIAEFTNYNNNANYTGALADSVEIHIKRGWGSRDGEHHIIQFLNLRNKKEFKSLVAFAYSRMLTKIRHVYDATNKKMYIDVYYRFAESNNIYIELVHPMNGYNAVDYWRAIPPILVNGTVEGETVTTEYAFPTSAMPATSEDLLKYLLLTGGTVKADGGTSTPFFVQSSNEGTNTALALIGFRNIDGAVIGRLGFDGLDNPIIYDTNAHRKKLIHEGNVAEYAATVENGLFDLEFVESSSSGAGSVFTIENCYYHKVGSHVFISGSKQNVTGAKTFNAGIKGTGLPFTPAVNGGTGEMVRVVACSADKPVAAAIKEGTDITYNLQTGGIVASGTLEQGKTLAVYGLYMTNA